MNGFGSVMRYLSHRVVVAGLGVNEGNHQEAKIFNESKGKMPGSLVGGSEERRGKG